MRAMRRSTIEPGLLNIFRWFVAIRLSLLAIVVLGFNTLRSVVLSSASEALHRSKQTCFKDRILWEHSVAVAMAAKTIAEERRNHTNQYRSVLLQPD